MWPPLVGVGLADDAGVRECDNGSPEEGMVPGLRAESSSRLRMPPRLPKSLAILFLAMSTGLGGCAAKVERDLGRGPEELPDGWKVAPPGVFGADVGLLTSAVEAVDRGVHPGIHCVLVVKGGYLVVEEYFDGYGREVEHEIRSATKSIGSILVGIAVDQGFIPSVDVPVVDYFEDDYAPPGGWPALARQVRIRHLLSMTSGYECDDLATDFACEHAMHSSPDWVRFALDLPFAHPPGQHWAYNSASLTLVGEAVARASGLGLDAFASLYLFNPLGVSSFRWERSPRGRPWMGGGARMVPRDMARIGQLMLQRGLWNETRVVSGEWVATATGKQADSHTGVDFGYLWQSGSAYVGLDLVTAFWASGNGGQYVVVLPEQDMVVVFTGGNYDSALSAQPFRMLVSSVLPAFMGAAAVPQVELSEAQMEWLQGTYRLAIEPAASATIAVEAGSLRLRSPDDEVIDLMPLSSTVLFGKSVYGPVTVVFEPGDSDRPARMTTYGSFQRFVFFRESEGTR